MSSGGIHFREIVAVDDPLFPAFLDAMYQKPVHSVAPLTRKGGIMPHRRL
jgi:hypothetical protein